jgi:hypothetical protein
VSEPAPSAPRLLTSELRWTFVLVGVLLLLSVVPTLIWSNETATRFAWTIKPPLTAAFMGAGYSASAALVFLAARERLWANARIAIPAALVFQILTLAATLVHFDRFHKDRVITWAWLAIYAAVPALLLVFTLRQLRKDGGEPPRERPAPPWARGVLVFQGLVMLTLGLALFAAPQTVDVLWPWSLTPLTGRIVGAWLVGLGVAAIHGAWEGDWIRLLPGAASYVVFGVLQLVNVARYPHTFDWGEAQSWLYVLFVATLVAFGVEALRRTLFRVRPAGSLST